MYETDLTTVFPTSTVADF